MLGDGKLTFAVPYAIRMSHPKPPSGAELLLLLLDEPLSQFSNFDVIFDIFFLGLLLNHKMFFHSDFFLSLLICVTCSAVSLYTDDLRLLLFAGNYVVSRLDIKWFVMQQSIAMMRSLCRTFFGSTNRARRSLTNEWRSDFIRCWWISESIPIRFVHISRIHGALIWNAYAKSLGHIVVGWIPSRSLSQKSLSFDYLESRVGGIIEPLLISLNFGSPRQGKGVNLNKFHGKFSLNPQTDEVDGLLSQ